MKDLVFCGGKFAYRALPKTASTSIKMAIYQIDAGEAFCREKEGMHIHAYMNRNKKNESSECEKRFVVVRDPVERFLSAYKNRVCFHGELSEPSIRIFFPAEYWNVPYFTPGLGQFIEHLEDYMLIPPVFHHCRPITDFFGDQSLKNFTHVYKMDELDRFENDLSEFTGKEVVFERSQTGGKAYFLRDLAKTQLQKLIRFYKADYELLEGYYSVDELWEKWRGDDHNSDVPHEGVKNKLHALKILAKKLKVNR